MEGSLAVGILSVHIGPELDEKTDKLNVLVEDGKVKRCVS